MIRNRISRTLVVAALAIGVWGLVPQDVAAGDLKVTICHIPPGNPENVQVIEVSESAAQKHIARHGDSIFGSVELCDGLDNDCNGFVDDGFPELGQLCADGESDCRQTGELICDPDDATQTTCSAVADDPLEPGGETTCTGGADEDCDGFIDCADTLDCAWDGDPSDITCKDPVCPDGIVDTGEECDGGVCCTGNCSFASAGTLCGIAEVCRQQVCNAAHECVLENRNATCDTDPQGSNNACDVSNDVCQDGVCTNTDPNPMQEIPCNGADENCNGDADDFPSGACDSGLPGICQAGLQACGTAPGEVICVATVMPGDVAEVSIDACIDGLDNDCDGLRDFEGLTDPVGDPDCVLPPPDCPCFTAEEVEQSSETSCEFQDFVIGGILSSKPAGLFKMAGSASGIAFCGISISDPIIPEDQVDDCIAILEDALGGCVQVAP